jgi:hypothetical protein
MLLEPRPDRLISKLSTETIARLQGRLAHKQRAEVIRGAIDEQFGPDTPPDPFDSRRVKAKVQVAAPQE